MDRAVVEGEVDNPGIAVGVGEWGRGKDNLEDWDIRGGCPGVAQVEVGGGEAVGSGIGHCCVG